MAVSSSKITISVDKRRAVETLLDRDWTHQRIADTKKLKVATVEQIAAARNGKASSNSNDKPPSPKVQPGDADSAITPSVTPHVEQRPRNGHAIRSPYKEKVQDLKAENRRLKTRITRSTNRIQDLEAEVKDLRRTERDRWRRGRSIHGEPQPISGCCPFCDYWLL